MTGAISEAYRTILQNRFRAYAEKGLAGGEPYDRGDGKLTQEELQELREELHAQRQAKRDAHAEGTST